MSVKIFAGVDEVGRGCLAGPVISCALILKENINKKILRDSKTISFKDRLKIAEHIKKNSWYAFGSASVKEELRLLPMHIYRHPMCQGLCRLLPPFPY